MQCPSTDLGVYFHAQYVSIKDEKGVCRLNVELLEEVCGSELPSCVEAMQLAAQASKPKCPRGSAGAKCRRRCPAAYLGPDVGWQRGVFDRSNDCRESVSMVSKLCGAYILECLAFLDTMHEHQGSSNTKLRNKPRWLATGTLTLHSRAAVVDQSSDDGSSNSKHIIFVGMVRNDIARSLNISMDFVSGTQAGVSHAFTTIH
jgi:hypothetical protein